MQIKKLTHAGWQNNLQLANDKVELIISLDVGPRILSYKTPRGENVLKNYPEQMGKSGEDQWMIRGGHRFWIAPEDEVLSYVPDNLPVDYVSDGPNSVRLKNSGVDPWKIRKEMTVTLQDDTSEVVIEHKATNEGSEPVEIASWGLSVMAPGGLEIIPLPPLGEHPRDLLPNRVTVAWPYTDLSDARWRFGMRFITLRQTAHGAPTKIGLRHTEKWIAYLMRNDLFIKTIDYVPGAHYPDLGCNFETFSNSEMLEIESLSPLKMVAPGDFVSHTEHWYLAGESFQPSSLKESDLAEWLAPHLARFGL